VGGAALETGTVCVLKVDGGAAEEALDAGTVAEGAALEAGLEGGLEAAVEVG
jgi:hypothetical protein